MGQGLAHLFNARPRLHSSTHIQVTSASLTWGWLCTCQKARPSRVVWALWATWVSLPLPWPLPPGSSCSPGLGPTTSVWESSVSQE